ncbi:MAG: N-acetylneuraminate synthase family protein [Candidatus Omnitrophota bacterium]
MKIADLDLEKEILIIAEIGNNHEGNFDLAKKMISLAAQAGANAVKFQVIVPEKLVSGESIERLEQLKKFQLSYQEFEKLSSVAKDENVLFLATPFDIESVNFLNNLVPAFKISSADNNFFPLIETVAHTAKPILLSAGLADIEGLLKTKNFIQAIWKRLKIAQDMAILHCVTSYPVKPTEANLLAILTLQRRFSMVAGYSDHTQGIDAAVLSVALGARIIEKHFTIRKNYSSFRDHKLSADPEEFSLLVKKVKLAVSMLGDGLKRLQDSEKEVVSKLRRSVAAKHNLSKGKVLTQDDITWLRCPQGINLGQEKLLGKRLIRDIAKGYTILIGDVN